MVAHTERYVGEHKSFFLTPDREHHSELAGRRGQLDLDATRQVGFVGGVLLAGQEVCDRAAVLLVVASSGRGDGTATATRAHHVRAPCVLIEDDGGTTPAGGHPLPLAVGRANCSVLSFELLERCGRQVVAAGDRRNAGVAYEYQAPIRTPVLDDVLTGDVAAERDVRSPMPT
jgi:hypothetical protein